MLTILVALLLVAYIVLAIRTVLRSPSSSVMKAWFGLASTLGLIGLFVILTLLYAKVDLAFSGKLRLYAITRSTNPDLTGGYGPTIVTLDAKQRDNGLDLIKLANNRQAAFVNVFSRDRVRLGEFANDTITYVPSEETRVGGLWWVHTNRSAYEVTSEIK